MHDPSDVHLVLWSHIDGLMQDCSIADALSMTALQSCTKPSIKLFVDYRCEHMINPTALRGYMLEHIMLHGHFEELSPYAVADLATVLTKDNGYLYQDSNIICSDVAIPLQCLLLYMLISALVIHLEDESIFVHFNRTNICQSLKSDWSIRITHHLHWVRYENFPNVVV